MVLNAITDSGLLGKTKGMTTHLLTNKDYNKMVTLSSVKEILSYLETETAYGEVFTDITPNRHNMERILNRSLVTDYFKIYHFTTNPLDKLFLAEYYKKLEIQVLKYIIESLFDKRSLEATMPEVSHYLSSNNRIRFSELMKAKSLHSLTNMLKDTAYYTILRESLKSGSTLFEIETRLDISYYFHLYSKVVKKYKNSSPVRKIVLEEIDLLNFLALYRLKKYYNMQASHIFSKIIPVYSSYSTKMLMTMLINSKSFNEFLEIAKNSHMSYILHYVDEKGTEEAYYIVLQNEFKKQVRGDQFSIILPLYYLFRKELEVKNLTLLSESVRYKKNKEEILKILYTVNEL